jgi:hypothetical protein
MRQDVYECTEQENIPINIESLICRARPTSVTQTNNSKPNSNQDSEGVVLSEEGIAISVWVLGNYNSE